MGFKDYFFGSQQIFTQANKEQQRESVHAVYSVSKNKSEYNSLGELRSEPTNLVKISLQRESSVDENCLDLNIIGEFRPDLNNLVKISFLRKSSVSINCLDLHTI